MDFYKKIVSSLILFPPLNSFTPFRSKEKLVSAETIQGNTVDENYWRIIIVTFFEYQLTPILFFVKVFLGCDTFGPRLTWSPEPFGPNIIEKYLYQHDSMKIKGDFIIT